MTVNFSRRDAFKISGAALGGFAMGSMSIGCGSGDADSSDDDPTQRYTYFDELAEFHPGEPIDPNAMRITFLGSSCMPRLTQACNSVFVQLGNGDSFVFDCGTGVVVKYYAMGIGLDQMDKIFLTHLHADHMGDVSFVYGFGPSVNRRSPLYIWGPGPSGVESPPNSGIYYDDGTAAFCKNLQELMRWHNESQSFLPTTYADPYAQAPPYLDIDPNKIDAYDLVCAELDWRRNPGIAYDRNGVLIKHFPVVHCRQGAIGYRLEWNGLSMVFTGDTKPSYNVIDNASGVDVLIHEIVMSPQDWVQKALHVPPVPEANYQKALQGAQAVQDSSHTPQKGYGYILSQLDEPPRLAVGTHFQASDDTVQVAMQDIRSYYPQGELIIATDLLVLDVSKTEIRQRRAVVSGFTYQAPAKFDRPAATTAKYDSPIAQLDMSSVIDPKNFQ